MQCYSDSCENTEILCERRGEWSRFCTFPTSCGAACGLALSLCFMHHIIYIQFVFKARRTAQSCRLFAKNAGLRPKTLVGRAVVECPEPHGGPSDCCIYNCTIFPVLLDIKCTPSSFHLFPNAPADLIVQRSLQTAAVRAQQAGLLLGALVRIYSGCMIQPPCFIVIQVHAGTAALMHFRKGSGRGWSPRGTQRAEYY